VCTHAFLVLVNSRFDLCMYVYIYMLYTCVIHMLSQQLVKFHFCILFLSIVVRDKFSYQCRFPSIRMYLIPTVCMSFHSLMNSMFIQLYNILYVHRKTFTRTQAHTELYRYACICVYGSTCLCACTHLSMILTKNFTHDAKCSTSYRRQRDYI
jgi:hypothetical protein